MATSNSKSASSNAKCPLCWYARSSENATTSALPSTAHSQNPSRARWCSSHAAMAAVASGSKAVSTAAWPELTWRKASASSSGNPSALHSMAMTSGLRWCGLGNGERVASKNTADRHPAITTRANVMNQGESWGASAGPVARRVMGRVRANTVTPTRPSHRPRVSLLMC